MLLAAAAAFGTYIAFLTYDVMCVHYEGELGCSGRREEYVWHLALAVAGLVAAAGMVWSAFVERHRAALVLLLVGIALYAVSFLFSDAAVHGWDDLKIYPTL